MPENNIKTKLMKIYQILLAACGPQHWWPGDTPFEVIIGAILTQSTAWTNVEKAIANLKSAGVLSAKALRDIPEPELAVLIQSSGYFNVKARKLKALVAWLGCRCGDDLDRFFQTDTAILREELLALYGVGEETADSILLYAGNQPSFVIDAYTRRIIDRLGLRPDGASYEAYRRLFMDHLPPDVPLYNEYHALFVRHGKDTCRKSRPSCDACCLKTAGLCKQAGLCKTELASIT